MRPTDTLHTLPTHLGVRDPVLWQLDEVQLLKVASGVLAAGFILRQTVLPVGVRSALGAVALLGAAACALVRIEGRSLEDWLLLVGRYWARPRQLAWRPRRPRHPWALAASTPRSAGPTIGARYCLRQIRVRWHEPTRGAVLAP